MVWNIGPGSDDRPAAAVVLGRVPNEGVSGCTEAVNYDPA
jgi:hypothetical protein